MQKGILLVGEPMGLFIAQQEGGLEQVDGYAFAIAGAEYNVAVGMSRLGHRVDYITKLGAAGALLSEKGQTAVIPGFVVEHVIDTVGAGDGFATGLVSALMEGLPATEAVKRGNAIGAIQVMSVGDNEGLPTREQLERFVRCRRKDW